jgi:hypothetical protein
MRLLLLIIVATGALLGSARAQEPGSAEALNAANELIVVMGPETIEQMSSAMISQMWPLLENDFRGKVDSATLSDIRTELERGLHRFINAAMKDAPAIYARYFSANELRDIIGFYKTTTGAKSLKLLPKITAETGALILPRIPAFQAELTSNIDAILKRRGYKN